MSEVYLGIIRLDCGHAQRCTVSVTSRGHGCSGASNSGTIFGGLLTGMPQIVCSTMRDVFQRLIALFPMAFMFGTWANQAGMAMSGMAGIAALPDLHESALKLAESMNCTR